MASYAEYDEALRRRLWSWADRHHAGQLDGGEREKRPPVLARQFASEGVLVPQRGPESDEILAAVPKTSRHRWFRSLKSSQALAQSVFGAAQAFDRLDLLRSLSAECGRPAFSKDHSDIALDLEWEVSCLEEPRPTSVDVMLRGPRKRVAIECKFMEKEFGKCSRTDLRPGDPTYPKEYCDGSYHVQNGRSERCALTEIGVRYWEHLPRLFMWPADRDHKPCPFGPVYQLARNALAAALTSDGEIDLAAGHMLLIFDARNPEFRSGGRAEGQWRAAAEACRVPGLLRRLSWQRVMAALAHGPEFAYLVDGVERKYGIKPD